MTWVRMNCARVREEKLSWQYDFYLIQIQIKFSFFFLFFSIGPFNLLFSICFANIIGLQFHW